MRQGQLTEAQTIGMINVQEEIYRDHPKKNGHEYRQKGDMVTALELNQHPLHVDSFAIFHSREL